MDLFTVGTAKKVSMETTRNYLNITHFYVKYLKENSLIINLTILNVD